MLTKNHYTKIAKLLGELDLFTGPCGPGVDLNQLIQVLSDYYEEDNPHFRPEVFKRSVLTHYGLEWTI